MCVQYYFKSLTMYMHLFTLFVVSFAEVILTAEGKTNCDTLGVNFYEKIGCARQNSGGDCPSFSDCKYERLPGKCLFNGAVLDNSKSLGDDQDVGCNFGCECSAHDNAKGSFNCAQGQCGFSNISPNSNCYTVHELNDCCGKQRCEPPKATCVVNGITYKEGERVSAKDECSECICTSEFNGKFEGPHCKRQGCAVEVRHSEDIENNCAPTYFVNNDDELLCCPVTFTCPSDEDKFTGTANSALQCKYGDKTIKSGVTLTRYNDRYGENRTVTCECKLPPLLTCIARK